MRVGSLTLATTQGVFAPLRRRAYFLAASFVVAAFAGYLLSAARSPVYEATARVVLMNPASPAFAESGNSLTDAQQNVVTMAERVKQPSTLRAASSALRPPMEPFELAAHLEVTADPALFAIRVTTRASTPERAAAMALETASAFEAVEDRAARVAAEEAITGLSSRLVQVETSVTEAAERVSASPGSQVAQADLTAAISRRSALQTQIDDLTTRSALLGSGIRGVEAAIGSPTLVSPRPLRDAALTGLLALVGVAGLIWYQADRRAAVIHPRDPVKVLGAPLLGEIPHLPSLREDGVEAGSVETKEPYEFVMTALHPLLKAHGADTLIVTSAQVGDGKTLTALHLAMAAGRDGRRVLLIDANLRTRPSGGSRALPPIADNTDLVDFLEHPQNLGGLETLDERANVSFVRGRSEVLDPPALLRGPGLPEFLATAAEKFDLVFIDTPDVLSFSDASTLASHAYGVVLVVAPDTPSAELEEARERLGLVGARILGYVFNRR
jgi:Mrp family chromosome partitioning ATPase/capsular polysaccharide biosynthesis protein